MTADSEASGLGTASDCTKAGTSGQVTGASTSPRGAEVLSRVVVEGLLASRGAEVIRLALLDRALVGVHGVDGHPADRVLYRCDLCFGRPAHRTKHLRTPGG